MATSGDSYQLKLRGNWGDTQYKIMILFLTANDRPNLKDLHNMGVIREVSAACEMRSSLVTSWSVAQRCLLCGLIDDLTQVGRY